MINNSGNNKHLIRILAALPAIFVLIDISTEFVSNQVWTILSIIRAAFMIMFIVYLLNRGTYYSPSVRWLMVFLTYLAILIPNSMVMLAPFDAFIRMVITTGMFLSAYTLVTSKEDLFKIINGVIAALIIININYLSAQIFKIGQSPYIEDSFYLGGLSAAGINTLVYGVLIIPFVLNNSKTKKYTYIGLLIISCIFLMLLFKRVSVGATGIGLLIYFLYSPNKYVWVKYAIMVIFMFSIIGFFYYDSIIHPLSDSYFIEKVEGRTQENPMTEGKFNTDLNLWYSDVKEKRSISRLLFGTDLGNEPVYYGTRRTIHVDYFRLLHGAGVVGFIMYIIFFIIIIREFKNGFWYIDRNIFNYDVRATFYAVLTAGMTISLSGGIFAITHRSIYFLLLGSLLAVCVKEGYKNIIPIHDGNNEQYKDNTDEYQESLYLNR